MNNLSSYCGLTDSRISASEKDLPVYFTFYLFFKYETIETYARAVLPLNISAVGSVQSTIYIWTVGCFIKSIYYALYAQWQVGR